MPQSALDFVLLREGVNLAKGDTGYVNNPDDPGGETRFGIAKRDHPNVDITHLTLEQARAIYDRDYWQAAHCDQFNDDRPRLALAHFDCAVNQGTGQSALCLQRAVGVAADGQVGPKTLEAARTCDETAAVSAYLIDRARIYKIIVARRPASQQFLAGWLARLRWCARECGVPIDPSYAQEA